MQGRGVEMPNCGTEREEGGKKTRPGRCEDTPEGLSHLPFKSWVQGPEVKQHLENQGPEFSSRDNKKLLWDLLESVWKMQLA